MSIAVYPLSHGFLVSGFQTALPERRVRTRAERGRPFLRGGPSVSGGRVFQMQTPAIEIGDVARFWRFWEEEIEYGARPFLLPEPRLDGLPIADDEGNILTDDGGNILTQTVILTCLFAEEPPPEVPHPQDGTRWLLSYSLLAFR